MLRINIYDTLTIKVKFERNKEFIEVTNDSTKVIVLDPKRIVAVLHIRLLGYYKFQQGVLQQRLSKYYSFESLQNIFEGYNNF